jgi:sugar fermentation stimulation protein A
MKRKTRYTVWAVEREGECVFLHTHQTNAVARFLLSRKRIPSLVSAEIVRSEVSHERSRFDFLMEEQGERFFLEVKSVTLFGNGAALFPDAVTDRGRHHLLRLAELGDEAAQRGLPKPVVLFLVHCDRVDRFLPDYHTDLAFARAFLEVRDRVRLRPVSVGWTRSLSLKDKVRELPIPWDFLQREVRDQGSYLLLLRIGERKRINIGRLGEIDFLSGWYVYIGSAKHGLTARIARHLRKRKRFHWHIDFLRDQAVEALALPIRSSLQEECVISDTLSRVLTPHSPGFGCSDCSCLTHLQYSAEKPLHSRRFHEVLQRFRMPIPSA